MERAGDMAEGIRLATGHDVGLKWHHRAVRPQTLIPAHVHHKVVAIKPHLVKAAKVVNEGILIGHPVVDAGVGGGVVERGDIVDVERDAPKSEGTLGVNRPLKREGTV